MNSLKDGWVIAIGSYQGVTIYIKHSKILDCYSESIICPIKEEFVPYPSSLEILNATGLELLANIKNLEVGKAKDIPSGSLLQSRLVICVMPSKTFDNDLILKGLLEGLEISNSIGCTSACIPVEKINKSLESSVELIIESIEHYALKNCESDLCMKEITICAQSEADIIAVIEASKFRMTRYSTFINIGLPSQELIPESRYCYECSRTYPISHKCDHCFN